MAVKDHTSIIRRLRVTIITVDPTQRIVEGIGKDGVAHRIAIFDTSSTFRWPIAGEDWTVVEQNGYWQLVSPWQADDAQTKIEDLQPGDQKLGIPEGRIILDTDATERWDGSPVMFSSGAPNPGDMATWDDTTKAWIGAPPPSPSADPIFNSVTAGLQPGAYTQMTSSGFSYTDVDGITQISLTPFGGLSLPAPASGQTYASTMGSTRWVSRLSGTLAGSLVGWIDESVPNFTTSGVQLTVHGQDSTSSYKSAGLGIVGSDFEPYGSPSCLVEVRRYGGNTSPSQGDMVVLSANNSGGDLNARVEIISGTNVVPRGQIRLTGELSHTVAPNNLQLFYTDFLGIHITNDLRMEGNNLFYWSDYGGGWSMTDTTFMRLWGDKSFWVGTFGGGNLPDSIYSGQHIVRIGANSSCPRIQFNRSGESLWEIDNPDNRFRIFMPGVVIAEFYAAGNAWLAGSWSATGYTTPSARALKSEIQPLTQSLSILERLRGVSFELKADPGKRQVGLIAEDVEEVFPEVVHEILAPGSHSTDSRPEPAVTIKSIDYGRLVTLAIEAIKELSERVSELEAQKAA